MQAQAIFRRISRWTFSEALPFWAERGVDRVHGGFVEALDLAGADDLQAFKRTRVNCRQVYVFSHAKLLGWNDGAALIAHGIDYLTGRVWQDDDRGFARRLTRQGELLDPTPDLYDYAFALFAFAWAYRATGDTHHRDWAHKTLDFIQAHLRHPGGEGFVHALPAEGLRRQNPHMHLLEASIAAYDATGETRFAEQARELVELFSARFFDDVSGTLVEYFDDGWAAAPGDDGRLVEPGHQFEWVWLLQNCRRALDIDAAAEMRALAASAERFGVDRDSGAVVNAVSKEGAPVNAGSRAWPNTERIKAAIALHELDGRDPMPAISQSGALLLDRYLTPQAQAAIPSGTWIDEFDAQGRPLSNFVPASTLYHLFLAFAEVMRLEEQLAATAADDAQSKSGS